MGWGLIKFEFFLVWMALFVLFLIEEPKFGVSDVDQVQVPAALVITVETSPLLFGCRIVFLLGAHRAPVTSNSAAGS